MSKSKIENHIDEIIKKIKADEKAIYVDLVNYCFSISLKPKKVYKPDILAVDFISVTDGVNVCDNNAVFRFGISKDNIVFNQLRYYASTEYSEPFHQAIRDEITTRKGKWVGCHHCGVGEKDGKHIRKCYYIEHMDGINYIRCGFGLVTIHNITKDDISEMKYLIGTQVQYYNKAIES